MAQPELVLTDDRKSTDGPLVVLFAVYTTEILVGKWLVDDDSKQRPLQTAREEQHFRKALKQAIPTQFHVRKMTFAETDALGITAGADFINLPPR